jgi:hypothetical protein
MAKDRKKHKSAGRRRKAETTPFDEWGRRLADAAKHLQDFKPPAAISDWFRERDRAALKRANETVQARHEINRVLAIRDGLIPPPWTSALIPIRPNADIDDHHKIGPDPFKTGAVGRPTAKAIVLAEAERRIREREVIPQLGGLTAFSEDLEEWWEAKRHTYKPPGPRMAASSIRSCGVRNLWNAALLRRQKL